MAALTRTEAKTTLQAIAIRSGLKKRVALFVALMLAMYLLRNVLLGTPVNTHATTSCELVQTVVASGRVNSSRWVTLAL